MLALMRERWLSKLPGLWAWFIFPITPHGPTLFRARRGARHPALHAPGPAAAVQPAAVVAVRAPALVPQKCPIATSTRTNSARRQCGARCPSSATSTPDGRPGGRAALVWGGPCTASSSVAARPACFARMAIDRLLGDIRARLRLEARLRDHDGGQPRHPRRPFRAFRGGRHAPVRWGAELQRPAPQGPGPRARPRPGDGGGGRGRQRFDTFNLDIITPLPGQTLPELERTCRPRWPSPPHISIYHLTIEPNTYFAIRPPFPEDDQAPRHARPHH